MRAVLDRIDDALWWLRHPSTRRCPECRLTWESRRIMRMQGGVCHDCFVDVCTECFESLYDSRPAFSDEARDGSPTS